MIAKRKDDFKKIIDQIEAGTALDDIKKEFSELLDVITPAEFSYFENELANDGISTDSLKTMQTIQLELFRKAVENQKPTEPPGHPVHTLMSEHVLLMEYVNELDSIVSSISTGEIKIKPEFLARVRELIGFFEESESHYQREENGVFPILEKHGLTGPPSAMWSEHQEIHALEKEIFDLNSEEDKALSKNLKKMSLQVTSLAGKLADHFYKENNILFPAALRIFSEKEWNIVVQDFEDVGYCSYTPRPMRKLDGEEGVGITEEGEVTFGSGTLTLQQLELIFNHLPVDTTFVDDKDRVRFFSESPDRIFIRSRAVIGRSVQLCHPKESIDRVQEILDDFRAGKRDSAEFWINLRGKTIHIRYFAVRDANGKYLGCLEVSQDITEIRKIKGEKRLIDG
ncbi:MAG: DUF438 domain-containing protein [Candidatus Thorarchaeota archaeon]